MRRMLCIVGVLICLAGIPSVAYPEQQKLRMPCKRLSEDVALQTPAPRREGIYHVNQAIVMGTANAQVTHVEIAQEFCYTPSSGFSAIKLVAQEGYCFLCVYIGFEDETARESQLSFVLRELGVIIGEEVIESPQTTYFKMEEDVWQKKKKRYLSTEGFALFVVPDTIQKENVPVTLFMHSDDDTITRYPLELTEVEAALCTRP